MPRKRTDYSLEKANERVSNEQRALIAKMLISGEFPIDAVIARAAGVPTIIVTDMLKKDPELVKLRESAEREVAQMIEAAGVSLCLKSRNDMARANLIPKLLEKMMPEKYGDKQDGGGSGGGGKKIIINMTLPEVKVDDDGIPIESKSPLEPEAIEVK